MKRGRETTDLHPSARWVGLAAGLVHELPCEDARLVPVRHLGNRIDPREHGLQNQISNKTTSVSDMRGEDSTTAKEQVNRWAGGKTCTHTQHTTN